MVLKLPPAAQVSKLEARIAFRLTMAHSNLSADLVAPLMYALRVFQQAERKLGAVLDTTKHWTNSGDNSCNCHLYPSDLNPQATWPLLSLSHPGSTKDPTSEL